jgi:hypothetical protein
MGMLDTFDTTVVQPMLDVMSNLAHVNTLEAQIVHGGGAFDVKTTSYGGHVSGDCLPTFVAWDFTLLRGGLGERNGYKRIAGVAETQQHEGIPTTGANTLLALVAAGMNTAFDSGGDVYNPVIRRGTINRVPQNPAKYYSVSNVLFARIGSQNSRKVGHGR